MSYISSRFLCASVVASAAFFALASAHATTVTSGDISVILGNPQPAEPHIFFDAATNTATGVGHVGSQTGDAGTPLIAFTNTGVNVDFANGYSTITPSSKDDPVFKSLTVSVPTGWFFTDLEFGTLKGNQVTITGKNGATTVGTYSNDAVGTGLEAWLVLAINSKTFTSLVITSSDGFTQMKEFAISGLQACTTNCQTTGGGGEGTTPIPAALPLFGSVLGGGLLFSRLRRKRRAA